MMMVNHISVSMLSIAPTNWKLSRKSFRRWLKNQRNTLERRGRERLIQQRDSIEVHWLIATRGLTSIAYTMSVRLMWPFFIR